MNRQPRGRQRGFRKDAVPLAAVERPGPAHDLLSPATDPKRLVDRRRAAVNELVRAEADDEREVAAALRHEIAVIDEALRRRQRDAMSNAFWDDE